MPGAQIRFDQAANPIPLGTAGVARDDIWLSQPVVCRSMLSGNTAWQWTFLDVPPGSAAVFSGSTTAAATFTPDIPGTYRIQLVTNNGGLGNIVVLVVRVRYSSIGVLLFHGLCLPAFGERVNEDNVLIPPITGAQNERGYAPFFEALLAYILTLGSGGSSPFVQPGGTGTVIEASDTTAPFTVGNGTTVPQISTTGGELLLEDTAGDLIILNDGSVEIEDASDDLFEMGGGNILLQDQNGDTVTIGFGAIDLESTAGGQLSLDSSGGASLTCPTLIQLEDGAGDTIEMNGGYVSVGSSDTTQLTLSATTSLAVTAPQVVNQPTANNGTITSQIAFTSANAASATQAFAIPANSAGRVDVIITGANGVDAGNATWSGKLMDLAGTVTVFKAFAVADEWDSTSGASTWTVSVAVSGTNISVTVQGSAGAGTINWTATLQYASTTT